MAFNNDLYGKSITAEGLVDMSVPHKIVTGVLQDDVQQEGGFIVWGKKGEGEKVWAKKPSDSSSNNGNDYFIAGVVVRKTTVDEFAKGDTVAVLKAGRIGVKASEQVTSGCTVWISKDGKFVNGKADSNSDLKGIVALSGGTYVMNAQKDELTKIEFAI